MQAIDDDKSNEDGVSPNMSESFATYRIREPSSMVAKANAMRTEEDLT